jgi:hypothetical protein
MSLTFLVLVVLCLFGLIVFLSVKHNPDLKTIGLHVFTCAMMTIMLIVFLSSSFFRAH